MDDLKIKFKELPDPLTAKECANFLRIHDSTVRLWIMKGDLKTIQVTSGKSHRISKSEFYNKIFNE